MTLGPEQKQMPDRFTTVSASAKSSQNSRRSGADGNRLNTARTSQSRQNAPIRDADSRVKQTETIPKLEQVVDKFEIKPVLCEMELHPCFQQQELFDYLVAHDIQPVGFMPLGSPRRPERDIVATDIEDMKMPELVAIAKAHNVHPATICLKWAIQRGQLPIPFSVHNYEGNLECTVTEPLTDEEMATIATLERDNRLVKGQVFLWPGANDWHDLWDEGGFIVDCPDAIEKRN